MLKFAALMLLTGQALAAGAEIQTVTVAGASADLTWTAPTLNTDGTLIPATGAKSITGYRVSSGVCAGAQLPANPQTIDVGPQLAATVTGIQVPGLWCFGVQTLANAAAPDNISAMSGIATKVVALNPVPNPPNPPGGLKVSATAIYQFIGLADKIQMLPVGTVPPNTACDHVQYVMGYFVVPQAGVTVSWFGSVKPKVVFAICA